MAQSSSLSESVDGLLASAALLPLPIPEANEPGVRLNLERMARMAAPLLAVSLPDDVESAQVFEP